MLKISIQLFPKPLRQISQWYLIGIILLFAFLIRLKGAGFGLPYLYHPDEENIVGRSLHMLASGDLNPHWFGHPGSFVIYVLAIVFAAVLAVYFVYCLSAGLVSDAASFKEFVETDPTVVYYAGRIFMILLAVVTVYLAYAIAKKLFNKPAALLSALCLAVSPLYVEHSRFIRTDIIATLSIVLSVYFLLRAYDSSQSSKFLILSSLCAGCSIAAKYTSGIIIFPILIYCLTSDSKRTSLLSRKYLAGFFKLRVNLSMAMLFIFIGFFVFAPFVIFDYDTAIKDIAKETRSTHLGHERLPGIYNHLWFNQK